MGMNIGTLLLALRSPPHFPLLHRLRDTIATITLTGVGKGNRQEEGPGQMSERRSTRQRETTVVTPAWVRVLMWIGFPLVGAGAAWLFKSAIIAQLTQANAALAQRVPELEAPHRPEDASEGRSPGPTPKALTRPRSSRSRTRSRPAGRGGGHSSGSTSK
jgi:hypothetical protein